MRTIGRYSIRGLLGRGGMATVYKVAMPVTDKIVALKILSPPELLRDILGLDELRRLFISEAVTMAQLRHPHIADVWDFDQHEGMPFFIMEYYCNNLGIVIGEADDPERPTRPLFPDRLFHYGKQILDGLACLHQAGIIHRDIKPFNLLLTDHDTVKIADFGLSRKHGEQLIHANQIKVGSRHYAAPEQHRDPDAVDARADLFAVGVTLYRMLHGTLPGDTPRRGGDFEDVDALLTPFLNRAMAADPEARFPSARQMLAELLELEKEWRQYRVDLCRIVGPTIDPPATTAGPANLRSQPARIAPRQARKFLKLDRLWRPKHYTANLFRDNGNGTVTDAATGLVWQQAGSPYPVTWEQANDYIGALNTHCWQDIASWRLPTVDELLSLVEPQRGVWSLCVEPLFAATQKWLWSIDCRSKIGAWYVNFELGFAAWQDTSCRFYARAVYSAPPG